MKDGGGGFEGSGTRGAAVAEGAARAGDVEDAATDSAGRAASAAKAAIAAATPAAPGTAIFAEPGPALGAAQSAKQSGAPTVAPSALPTAVPTAVPSESPSAAPDATSPTAQTIAAVTIAPPAVPPVLNNVLQKRDFKATTSTLLDSDGRYLFSWPLEPKYVPLAHDLYRVSSGEAELYGLTHNNGQQRERHYVYILGRSHYGFDITADPGTEVRASAAGTVIGVYTSTDEATNTSDYGRYVVIDHGPALAGLNVYTVYAHLEKSLVKTGDQVKSRQKIGLSGNSGGSRIPHLHLEFRIETNDHAHNVDPLEMLPPFDFGGLSAAPGAEGGFMRSSVELYLRMAASAWKFDVYVKTAVDKVFDDGITILAGTELQLVSRSDKDFLASVLCNGETYPYALDELQYTYK
jgi:murein DD-endopeptidase MepM/ murein hydrolase activator NlpD